MTATTAAASIAAAGLTVVRSGTAPASAADRAVLAGLLQARTALRRYGVNLDQAVAAINSGAGAPVWLLQAVAGCARAADRMDEATVQLTRRLGRQRPSEADVVIGKACRRGSSVRRLLGYLFTEGLAGEHGLESAHRDAHVIAGYEPAEQLEPTRDAQGRAQLSRLAALLDAHVKAGGVGPEAKPVYHLAISAAPGDRLLTDAEWADIAGQHVQHLGLVPVGDPDGVRWVAVRHADNHVHFRFHDLRHTGNTLAAGTGASTKELMSRMGHASRRAALRYQHATTDRDAAIAVALSELAGQAAPTPPAGNGATPGVWRHDR